MNHTQTSTFSDRPSPLDGAALTHLAREALETARSSGSSQDYARAETLYRQILAITPNDPSLWSALAQLLHETSRHAAEAAALTAALAHSGDPTQDDEALALLQRLIVAHFLGADRPFSEMQALGRQWGRALAARSTPYALRPKAGLASRPLRLGFHIGCIGDPGVTIPLAHAMNAAQRAGAEVFVYGFNPVSADHPFRHTYRQFADLSAQTPSDAAQAMASDQLDVLMGVDFPPYCGHAQVFAHRPAALSGLMIHSFISTGGLFDFVILDKICTTSDNNEGFVDESVILQPDYFLPLCKELILDRPPPSPPPRRRHGRACYGCFNRPSKIDPRMARVFAQILRQDPASRLLLGSSLYDLPGAQDRVRDLLQSAGVDLSRVDFFGQMSWLELLRRYDDIDVALDTLAFSGGLTSLDALLQGVPLVTLCGDRPTARLTASLLTNLGLNGLIAESEEEMAALAVSIAHDDALSSTLRAQMRQRFINSPVVDADRFYQSLEGNLRQLLLDRFPEAA